MLPSCKSQFVIRVSAQPLRDFNAAPDMQKRTGRHLCYERFAFLETRLQP
jgi:hypothetical protein